MNINAPLRVSESIVQIQQVDNQLHILTSHGRIFKYFPLQIGYTSFPPNMIEKYRIEPHWELIHEHPLYKESSEAPNDGGRKNILGTGLGESKQPSFRSKETTEPPKIYWNGSGTVDG